jgi:hypothetical protein
MNAANPHTPPNTHKSRWPLIVIALLVGHICLMTVAVAIATHDRNGAIIPDYYQKAVNWDRTQAQLRANASTAGAHPTTTAARGSK